MRLHFAFAVSLAASVFGGCTFEEHCYDTLEAPADPAPPLRNPHTGTCEYYGGGGGGGGGSTCGDYGGGAAPDRAAYPDWGFCDGYCESLSESECYAASECRGMFVDPCADPEVQCEFTPPSYFECWAVSPSGPQLEGDCSEFGAEECARHNECVAVHADEVDGIYRFAYCMDEPSNPVDPGSCEGEVLCDALPPDCPEGTLPGVRDGCYTGYCIPLDDCELTTSCEEASEVECISRAECEPVYEGIDCRCDGDECICKEWVFESCS